MNKLFCLAYLLCMTQLHSQSDYSVLSIPKEFKEYANSVLMDELVETDVTNDSKMSVKTRRVVAVLNKLGDDNVGAYVFYDKETKVRDLEAYVYDAFGKEIEHFRKKDFRDISRADGISIYNDDRILYLAYTPTAYPYIVVFSSEIETSDTAFMYPWFPMGSYSRSTLKSVAKTIYNPKNKIKYKAENIEGYNIEITDQNNEIVCTATNIPTIRYEENSPSFYSIAPKVRFALDQFNLKGTKGSGKDWEQFGNWMDKNLLSDVKELPEGTIARVKSLAAQETTNEGKARKIYQYVQDKVRYISIQIGIGGWKPMLASDVDKLGYGDCKALTNYTKSLLEAVGVPAYYTILYAGDEERNITEDFTAMQGNHAILGVPDGEEITFLECTSQDTPYGFLGNFTDDRDVLVVTPEGGKIVHTKIYTTEENIQENTAKVNVDDSGNVSASFKSISKGLQYDEKYLLPKQKQEVVEKYLKDRWSYINGLAIINTEFENNKEDIIFSESDSIEIPHYANSVGNDYLLCPNIFNRQNYIPPRIIDRKQNLYLSEGYIHTDTVEIEIPENYTVDALPEETVLETKFGKYSMGFSVISENKIVYHRNLLMNKGEYPPEEYENYRDFRRSVARLDKAKILLKQNLQ